MTGRLKYFPKEKVTEFIIERVPDPTARTQEQHDLSDMFILRAKLSDNSRQYICEVTGKQNLPTLENAKASLLSSLEH